MKISTELRHIINSRFPVFAGSRVPENKAARLVAEAAKKEPQIKKALAEIVKAQTTIKAFGKVLARFGIGVYNDGEWHLDDLSKLEKIVSLPPKPVTRNDVLNRLASLSTAEGVSYLKSLGIDWS